MAELVVNATGALMIACGIVYILLAFMDRRAFLPPLIRCAMVLFCLAGGANASMQGIWLIELTYSGGIKDLRTIDMFWIAAMILKSVTFNLFVGACLFWSDKIRRWMEATARGELKLNDRDDKC